MVDAKFIREHARAVKDGMKHKNLDPKIVEDFLTMDEVWRVLTKELDDLRAEHKELTHSIRSGSTLNGVEGLSDARDTKGAKAAKAKIQSKEEEYAAVERKRKTLWLEIPNPPSPDVPVGKDEKGNQVIRTWGEPTTFDFEPKDHLALGEARGLIDTERAAKISGTRFAYLTGDAVLLEFALIGFAFDTLIPEGFTPVIPPVLVRENITEGLGYWQAGGEKDHYRVHGAGDDGSGKQEFYLVGTAEHSLVPMHADEILKKRDLPKRYMGFSTCFRREAGSYGKDTRGIIRVHQFDKVEMVSFASREDGDSEHEYLLSLEEKLFQALGIPYRVVKICTADLGFPIARKYDLEAWLPGEGRYREVTSTSTTTDFQARRLNVKYSDGAEKRYAHIINGTAFAIGRTLAAIFENFQTKDGKIRVPAALQKYIRKELVG
ncbi:MAG: serine--tRNA ligase [Candidatus Liptonbacteria bacterium RIFCSPLOWO2_01_FULL_56_20]|uniref:Serine--tRNA ligase n=1 Tax=Candidatus Liptonbacteria bacterium RIFCSPLOWO2_01_FULL_56_20 TaxID=1798652 RepID=A0A1G2CKX7_9BACT|nr:MAG: serine--tRNA ligase [Candidatus Liptonbacteria bacterium RIFCSPHIGHO2_01_FULL_56_18b]OGZ01311.1 MAG: serine--tRNA ligase [Candidatus Liptonbacteria bacterium RIFCSPLOWO2_01_FULL_56_20]